MLETTDMPLMAYMMCENVILEEIEMLGKTAVFKYKKNKYEDLFNKGEARVCPRLFHRKMLELRARINQQKTKKSYY